MPVLRKKHTKRHENKHHQPSPKLPKHCEPIVRRQAGAGSGDQSRGCGATEESWGIDGH